MAAAFIRVGQTLSCNLSICRSAAPHLQYVNKTKAAYMRGACMCSSPMLAWTSSKTDQTSPLTKYMGERPCNSLHSENIGPSFGFNVNFIQYLWQKLKIYSEFSNFSNVCTENLSMGSRSLLLQQGRRWLIPDAMARKLLVFPL